MQYEILGNRNTIDFGAQGIDEILQNVQMILTTPIFSVPLDRAFGVNYTLLDSPTDRAMMLLRQEILAKIEAYEPRVVVREITYIQDKTDLLDGKLIPKVTVDIHDDVA